MIVLDIECVAIDNAAQLLEPVTAPSNYRDEAKIAAYVQEKQAEQTTRAALFPWTAKVVAIGLIEGSDERVMVCATDADERAALECAWRMVYEYDARFVKPIITFNGLSYDLPVLLARSMLLGVQAPRLNLDRYRSPHIDLLQLLTWRGTVAARSLKWYARRFGIPVDDTVSGADIAALVKAGEWDAVRAHCLSDIQLTKALAERLGVVRGAQLSVGAA